MGKVIYCSKVNPSSNCKHVFDVQFSPGVEAVGDILSRMEQLWKIARPS